jgi:hypothetical protein
MWMRKCDMPLHRKNEEGVGTLGVDSRPLDADLGLLGYSISW